MYTGYWTLNKYYYYYYYYYVSLKVPRVIGILFRLKHICPQELVLLTLCNTLIIPHLSYCIMVWGSKIQTNNRLHLLQKAARIITNEDSIAHTEPICKLLNILKATDLFKCLLWKFYYKLTRGQRLAYFDIMLPILPNICNHYSIRLPTFHLLSIKLAFAEQRLDYHLIKMFATGNCNLITYTSDCYP